MHNNGGSLVSSSKSLKKAPKVHLKCQRRNWSGIFMQIFWLFAIGRVLVVRIIRRFVDKRLTDSIESKSLMAIRRLTNFHARRRSERTAFHASFVKSTKLRNERQVFSLLLHYCNHLVKLPRMLPTSSPAMCIVRQKCFQHAPDVNISSANCPAFHAERDVPVKRSQKAFEIHRWWGIESKRVREERERENERAIESCGWSLLYAFCGWCAQNWNSWFISLIEKPQNFPRKNFPRRASSLAIFLFFDHKT